jgi:hypothetical protein
MPLAGFFRGRFSAVSTTSTSGSDLRQGHGFDSLSNVMLLFTKPEIALAGWIHYLAFDLFVGSWEVRTARAERIPLLIVLPCLLLTFLFGPAGYLVFTGLRAVRAMTPIARTPLLQ